MASAKFASIHGNATMKPMHSTRSLPLFHALTIMVTVLIWKVAISVVLGYRDYFPPNFNADFLLGREAYFWNGYHWAFYVHLFSGPSALLLGTVLISTRFRQSYPKWHRYIGRVQVANVLLFVVPSGLWMAYYAATGTIAAWGLGSLAIVTWICIALGWRAAMRRKFTIHEHWMKRTFILLCSAVVIRLIGGLATVLHYDNPQLYAFSTWASWLVPLVILELYTLRSRFLKNPPAKHLPRR